MMMTLGMTLTLTASVLLYAGAAHQKMLPRPSRMAGWVGGALLLGGLALLLAHSGPATAIFVWMTIAMGVWSIVPLAAAWRRFVREARS